MPLVAGFDDRQAHLVQARHFARQRLEDAHLGLADPWPHHALVVGHERFQAGLEGADRLAGQEPVAVERHGDVVRQQQRPQVVADLRVLLPGQPDAALEDGASLPLLPGLLDAALVGSKTTVPFVVEMLALSQTARTSFSPKLYCPRCSGLPRL